MSQVHFERMMLEHVPNANLNVEQEEPLVYEDPNVQAAWIGHVGLSRLNGSTTNDTNDNHEQIGNSG